jgi:cell division protein ZapE
VNIRNAYQKSLKQQDHTVDPAQQFVVDQLGMLQMQIVHASGTLQWIRNILSFGRKKEYPGVPGMYLWGDVGRGKTFLMDLFFETLPTNNKTRIHFHRMMADVHARLKALDDVEDPLDKVAADIARQSRILCFDEFFVSDIADAMILGRLLDGLFRRGVILVATSNSPPSELYLNGLQRERFLPAIDLIEAHTRVLHLDGDTDYRLRLLQQAGTYLTPADVDAVASLTHYFLEIATGDVVEGRKLAILGRDIQTERCAKGIVWFDFNEICDGPRSQHDYIEIARWYPTVIVSGIPVLDAGMEDQARRFIALVDEFYDRKVKLIVSAASGIESLYTGRKLDSEFRRTTSRLGEMQSMTYLHAAHLC